MNVLSDNEAEARWENIRAETVNLQHEKAVTVGETYSYVRPLAVAADSLIDVLENREQRLHLGISQLDVLTRGFGAKELVFISGFAHSAKTQLLLTAIVNNPARRWLVFSLDDPAEMLLTKLVCMVENLPATELEHQIRNGDAAARDLIRRHARTTFANLVIIDQTLNFGQMKIAYDEAVHYWDGETPHAIAIDYLGLIPFTDGGADGFQAMAGRANALKNWAKELPCPLICIHQGSRGGAKPGQPLNILSMAYGGEQQATMIIGVRRKTDDDDADEHYRRRHANTVTIHLVKNKRPPSRKTPPDGIDFWLEPQTGFIRPLRDGELNATAAITAQQVAAAHSAATNERH